MPDYQNKQNLEEEIKLHEQQDFFVSGHWSANPMFISRQRNWLKNDVQKIRFYGYLFNFIKQKPYKANAEILIAPVGDGSDLKYLEGAYNHVHGIDISCTQLNKCPKTLITKNGDIMDSKYNAGSFDIIVASLIFHHLHNVGFSRVLSEFHRLLRKGGMIIILEPSALYPFSWVTALLSKLLGDFPCKVKGEKPILPHVLIKELKHAGFHVVQTRGITFNHIVFPFFLQLIINLIDWPFRIFWPFKLCAETVGFYCEKP